MSTYLDVELVVGPALETLEGVLVDLGSDLDPVPVPELPMVVEVVPQEGGSPVHEGRGPAEGDAVAVRAEDAEGRGSGRDAVVAAH